MHMLKSLSIKHLFFQNCYACPYVKKKKSMSMATWFCSINNLNNIDFFGLHICINF